MVGKAKGGAMLQRRAAACCALRRSQTVAINPHWISVPYMDATCARKGWLLSLLSSASSSSWMSSAAGRHRHVPP